MNTPPPPAGIMDCGVYVPRMRLDRREMGAALGWTNPALGPLSRGTRAVCDFDEDVITMAVAAARHCRGSSAAGGLFLGSTTMPFADRLNASVVAAAMDLGEGTAAYDLGGSLRSGLSALALALGPGAGDAPRLCIAADRRRGPPGTTLEMTSGDGAVAFLVGSDNVIARLVGRAVRTLDFVDHYRRSDQSADFGWEERWVRDEGFQKILPGLVADLLAAHGVAPGDVDHFILPGTVAGVQAMVAARAGIRADAVRDPLAASCGDTGSAHPLLMLADALGTAGPGETILVVQFAQGGEALLFQTTDHIAGWRRPDVQAALASGTMPLPLLRHLAFSDQLHVDFGIRGETVKHMSLSAAYRHAHRLARLVAGECTVCGAVQFPKANICVNPNCRHEGPQRDHQLVGEQATVRSITTDWLGFSRNPPNRYGMVEFESGARLMVNFTSSPAEPATGDRVAMVYRIQDFDPTRNLQRYGWKAEALPPPGDAPSGDRT